MYAFFSFSTAGVSIEADGAYSKANALPQVNSSQMVMCYKPVIFILIVLLFLYVSLSSLCSFFYLFYYLFIHLFIVIVGLRLFCLHGFYALFVKISVYYNHNFST